MRLLKWLETPQLKRPGTSLPRLESQRLILRAPKRRDARDVFAYAKDPLVSRYVLWDAHRSLQETRRYLSLVQWDNRLGEGRTFVAERKADGRVIGTAGFVWLNSDNHTAEVGYSFGRDFWGQGYAAETLRTLLAYGFHTLGLNRIEGQCDVRNPASAHVMEKCGMALEGRLKERVLLKGEYVDVLLYATTKRAYGKEGTR